MGVRRCPAEQRSAPAELRFSGVDMWRTVVTSPVFREAHATRRAFQCGQDYGDIEEGFARPWRPVRQKYRHVNVRFCRPVPSFHVYPTSRCHVRCCPLQREGGNVVWVRHGVKGVVFEFRRCVDMI